MEVRALNQWDIDTVDSLAVLLLLPGLDEGFTGPRYIGPPVEPCLGVSRLVVSSSRSHGGWGGGGGGRGGGGVGWMKMAGRDSGWELTLILPHNSSGQVFPPAPSSSSGFTRTHPGLDPDRRRRLPSPREPVLPW